MSERLFFIPSQKTLIPQGLVYLSCLESSCVFPLDGTEKRARDVSGGAAYLEQQKLEFGVVIPTRSEGVAQGFGGE